MTEDPDARARRIRGVKKQRLHDRFWLLIGWSVFVVCITTVGIGFAGGVKSAYSGPESAGAWLLTLSPIIPLILWLGARRNVR